MTGAATIPLATHFTTILMSKNLNGAHPYAFGALALMLLTISAIAASETIQRLLPVKSAESCGDSIPCLDLIAQQSMAVGTFAMAWLSFGALAVGVLTLFFLWRTVIYTREAASSAAESVVEARKATTWSEMAALAARSTVDLTHKNSETQLRAYMGLETNMPLVGINPMTQETETAGFQALVKNAGQTPAIVSELHTAAVLVDPSIDRPVSTFVPNPKMSFGTLLPGSSIRMAPTVFTIEQLRALFERKQRGFVMGYVEFTDVFSGEEKRVERFCSEVSVQVPVDFIVNAFNEQMITTVNYAWFEFSPAQGPVLEE